MGLWGSKFKRKFNWPKVELFIGKNYQGGFFFLQCNFWVFFFFDNRSVRTSLHAPRLIPRDTNDLPPATSASYFWVLVEANLFISLVLMKKWYLSTRSIGILPISTKIYIPTIIIRLYNLIILITPTSFAEFHVIFPEALNNMLHQIILQNQQHYKQQTNQKFLLVSHLKNKLSNHKP